MTVDAGQPERMTMTTMSRAGVDRLISATLIVHILPVDVQYTLLYLHILHMVHMSVHFSVSADNVQISFFLFLSSRKMMGNVTFFEYVKNRRLRLRKISKNWKNFFCEHMSGDTI
jgi:hypothetical protein